jgi:hypothetical protein
VHLSLKERNDRNKSHHHFYQTMLFPGESLDICQIHPHQLHSRCESKHLHCNCNEGSNLVDLALCLSIPRNCCHKDLQGDILTCQDMKCLPSDGMQQSFNTQPMQGSCWPKTSTGLTAGMASPSFSHGCGSGPSRVRIGDRPYSKSLPTTWC